MVFPANVSDILHPMTVHFPIALILTAAFLAIIHVFKNHDPEVNRTVRLLTLLSAVSAWVAVITGGLTPNYTGEINSVEGIHHIFAITTSIIISVSAAIYLLMGMGITKKVGLLGWSAFFFLLLAVITVSITGYFGGYIVYNLLL